MRVRITLKRWVGGITGWQNVVIYVQEVDDATTYHMVIAAREALNALLPEDETERWFVNEYTEAK